MILKGQNHRIFRRDESAIRNGLNAILNAKVMLALDTALLLSALSVYLEQDFRTVGMTVSNNWLLVLALAIPAIQLNATTARE